jgi:gluconate 2-dehydrogenase gamma chain
MSNFVPIESFNRRDLIRGIAMAMTAFGSLDLEAAQHVHAETEAEKKNGPYKVKAFNAHEYATIQRLAVLIVPADKVSGSALDAGAPEFIDTLSSQNPVLADIYRGGLAWLDAEMRKRYAKHFVDASAEEQTAMLDVLVAAERAESARRGEELVYTKSPTYKEFSGYTVKRANELAAGVKFFDWVRKMTVDAYYTSRIGIKDLGYVGNGAYSKYEVPQASIDYAMARMPK